MTKGLQYFFGFLFLFMMAIQSCKDDDQNVSSNVDPDLLPKVETNEVTGIENFVATSGGRITFNGGSEITRKGICWSENPRPSIIHELKEEGNGIEPFVSQMDSLKPVTKYFVRAFAANKFGLVYGEERMFETLGRPVDLDGNEYQTISIGNQEWFAENLKTTKYRSGDTIIEQIGHNNWRNSTVGAYVENFIFANINAKNRFGYLYNYRAIDNVNGLCPTGWHVSRAEDWEVLFEELGNDLNDIGRILKEQGDVNWIAPNNGIDSIGFAARGGGLRIDNLNQDLPNGFNHFTLYAYFWTSSLDSLTNMPIVYRIKNDESKIEKMVLTVNSGASIRCVKD